MNIRTLVAVTLLTVAAGCTSEPPVDRNSLTISYTNDMRGEIRACGCATRDYGGLGRRSTFLHTVRDTAAALVLVEGGGFFGTKLNYGHEKADLTLKSMKLMGYDGIVIGDDELGFGIDFIVSRTREIGLPVIVANLWDAAADTLYFPATRELTMKTGVRVGMIGVMSERLKLPPQVPAGTVRLTSALDAVREHAADLRARVDVVVVLAHMGQGQVQQIARAVADVDVIVQGSEGRMPRRTRKINNAYLLRVASEGRYAGTAHLRLGEDGRVSSLVTDVTPLSKIYADDEAISRLFAAYDLDVAAKEKSTLPTEMIAARGSLEKPFTTAEACQPCHEEIDLQWRGTKHAHAFDILASKSREYDRDCTPCHSTGFYQRGGFEGLALTPELIHVQCESCHGNGRDHVEDPKEKTPGDARAACRDCHTVEQTPEFAFEEFWARIQH